MARILLLDDERLARTLYGDVLRGAGHEVTAVASIPETKEALARGPYDIVVTDFILPEGGGMDVLHYTKERYPDTEVLVITGLDKVAPAVHAIKSGAAEYLVKPVAPEVLEHAVRRALATRSLLQENASLRRHVSLLETGQRISTTLDRQQLASITGAALQSWASASAVLLFERDTAGQPRLLGTEGLSSPEQAALLSWLAPHLESRETQRLEGAPGPWPYALSLPALEGEELLGSAVLLFPTLPPERIAEATSFLTNCLALALRTLGRFAEVEDLAYLDDLTHLFNLRYLHRVMDREVKNAQHTQGVFSVLFMDLDSFKSINDTHGHLVGSQLLVEAAHILRGCVRDQDVVARYGGDEYVVLLRGTDSGGALRVAERIRHTLETHRFLAREGFALALTTSIGVASFPEHARDKASLLELADRALYQGKRTRNTVCLATEALEATPRPGQRESA
ncbi:MAG TPA: diguanylate cyclase [Myxococcaceae bacterium]|nr:diguanylate cyclase [Myxococcaceae bacterium]